MLSTGTGSENSAIELRSVVDRCPHKGDLPKSSVELARELLDGADLLIEAAQRCIAADGKQSRAEELLDIATEQTVAAEQALNQALELDSAAVDDRCAARDLADSAGYPSEDPVEAEPLLDVAEARVVLVQSKLNRSGKSRARERVRKRAATTHAKIQAVRSQLDA